MVGCSFVNNTATYGGGAIYIHIGSGCTVVGCSFVNNTATYGGGAIYIHIGSGCTVVGCSFVNNTATYGGGAIYIHIYTHIGSVTVSNSTFVNNKAANNGNAIYGTLSCTANDNWWGTNTPNWGSLVYNINHVSYTILTLTATSNNVVMKFYKNGTNEVVPISRSLTLTIDDNIVTEEIVNGTFSIHYTAPTGEYNITAIVDNEKLTINVSNTTDSIIGDKSS